MKKLYFSVFLFVIFTTPIFAANPYDSISEKLMVKIADQSAAVAVMPFDSGSDTSIGEAVANEIISALTSQGAVVVERRSMDKILNELSLQQTGLIDEDTVSRVGKSLGAKYIVTGTAKEFNRPGYTNVGLKIQARLVYVESGKILVSANTEVEKSDITEPYKRREAAGPLRYSAMLGLTFGLNMLDNSFYDSDSGITGIDVSATLSGAGFEGGIQYFPEKNNFFGTEWELYYYQGVYSVDDTDFRMRGGAFSWGPVLRLPLWRFMDFMPFMTHIYFGPSFGYGYYIFENDKSIESEFNMHRFFINVRAGFVLGMTDFLLLGVQYTYNPDAVAGGAYTANLGTESSSGQAELKGHEIYFSVIFTP